MFQEYNKLVRDRIPEIIHKAGNECEVVTMSPDEYKQALRDKLIEEAQEAAGAANSQDLVKELADLYEVIDAVILTYGIERESVLAEQNRRRSERGGFEQRIKLRWTKSP
ncbi:MAG: nucleoside triphosphate pyrophosphohydrolase [Microcoleus vaginatus WJT46-NPBG5]|jgi:predicted house-cleaning noncanonical NTP pyrophosphatase (MazG superfamily)|nr:nucleoside triphosphate pyrophosphohydrolase [Microcoleus vaginatus WJT46-NPBG5]